MMVVVCGSWGLCGGCVCESREVSKMPSYVEVPTTSDIQG